MRINERNLSKQLNTKNQTLRKSHIHQPSYRVGQWVKCGLNFVKIRKSKYVLDDPMWTISKEAEKTLLYSKLIHWPYSTSPAGVHEIPIGSMGNKNIGIHKVFWNSLIIENDDPLWARYQKEWCDEFHNHIRSLDWKILFIITVYVRIDSQNYLTPKRYNYSKFGPYMWEVPEGVNWCLPSSQHILCW